MRGIRAIGCLCILDMIYNLADEKDRQRMAARFEQLCRRGAVAELTEKSVRNLSQNAYLHVCLAVVAMELGESIEYVKKFYFKTLANPSIFVVEKTDAFVGRVKVLRSSASVSKEEMSNAIERFRNWASTNDIRKMYIPQPHEEERIKAVMTEMANCNWL